MTNSKSSQTVKEIEQEEDNEEEEEEEEAEEDALGDVRRMRIHLVLMPDGPFTQSILD